MGQQLGFREITFISTNTNSNGDSIATTYEPIKINGKHLLIKGVNRHDTDTAYGKTTPKESLEKDIELMKKYNIPASNVIRHFDVTGKLCPAYWSGRENAGKWESEFHGKIAGPDYRAQLQKRAGLTDGTMDYLSAYQYGDDLIRKLATMR